MLSYRESICIKRQTNPQHIKDVFASVVMG